MHGVLQLFSLTRIAHECTSLMERYRAMLQLPEIGQIRRLRVVEVTVWWYRLSGQKSTNFESED